MTVLLNVNGNDYPYPEDNDSDWGTPATQWAQSVTTGMLQKAGGDFTLLADVNFGATYGLISTYFKSRSSNIADAGQVRLANTDSIRFRNAANDGNIALALDGNDLTWAGSALSTEAYADGVAAGALAAAESYADGVAAAAQSAAQSYADGILATHASDTSTHGVTGDIVGTGGSQTLTDKTFTSPVLNTGVSGTAVDTDGTLAANSDTKLASQKATKTYVDNSITAVTGAADSFYDMWNLSLATAVGSNELTVSVKTKAGSDPSGSSPVKIGFRDATLATGTYNIRSVTGALSPLVVSSGSTLGTTSGVAGFLYVYAIDNAGTVELAISKNYFADGSIVSTSAEGGSGNADSGTVMYSTSARSNVPCRLLGRLTSSQAVAGTWDTAISAVSLGRPDTTPNSSLVLHGGNGLGGSSSGETSVRNHTTVVENIGEGHTYTARTTTAGDKVTINYDSIWSISYSDRKNDTTCHAGITVNSNELSTAPELFSNPALFLICGRASNTFGSVVVSGTFRLKAGDVIRCQATTGMESSANNQFHRFIMTEIYRL